MPNTKSAAKALRKAGRQRSANNRKRRALRETLKEIERAIAAKKRDEALKLFSGVQKTIDKSAKSHIIAKNTASRKKSRLAKQLARL